METKLKKSKNLPLSDQPRYSWFYEWLGDFPSTWGVERGKFLFRNQKEPNNKLQCDMVLALTLSGVMRKEDLVMRSLVPSDYATYQIFYPDDLVFKLIDLENFQTSRVGLVKEKGIMSPAYIRLTPIDDRINSKFFYYYYYCLYTQGIYNFLGMGVRSSLGPSDLLNIPVLIPDLDTQSKIVKYLDDCLDTIGSFEKATKANFKLLKEYKASLIYNAVTGKIKI